MVCGQKKCGGPIKPKIQFIGEKPKVELATIFDKISQFNIPEKEPKENCLEESAPVKVKFGCDLMILIGTNLTESTLSQTLEKAKLGCPQILIDP